MQKRNFSWIFRETIPVVIGILISGLINNLQKRYTGKQYSESTIRSIRLQNVENINELEYDLTRQVVLPDTSKRYLPYGTKSFFKAIARGDGLYTPDLKSFTRGFLIEGRNHILVSYEVINQLGEREKYEDLLRVYNKAVKDILFNIELFEHLKMKRVLWVWLRDSVGVEHRMIRALNKFDLLIAIT